MKEVEKMVRTKTKNSINEDPKNSRGGGTMKQLSIEDWFEKLVLNVLPYEQWTSLSEEECAYLVFQRYMRSPERSWGWSWGSWLSTIFDGDEFYDSLQYEEKMKLDKELLDYVKKLAMRVPEEKREELRKLCR